jgi:hypothetical protein
MWCDHILGVARVQCAAQVVSVFVPWGCGDILFPERWWCCNTALFKVGVADEACGITEVGCGFHLAGAAVRVHRAVGYRCLVFLWLGGALRAHSADSYSGEVCYVVILGGSVSAHMLRLRFAVAGSRAWFRFPDGVNCVGRGRCSSLGVPRAGL